jgi:PAS domain S-box-containing protein
VNDNSLLDEMAGEIAGCAAIRLSPEGVIIHWHATAARILGHGPDAALGQRLDILYLPDDVADGRPLRDLAQARVKGRFSEEAPRRRRDGSSFWAATTIRRRDAPEAGFVVLIQDLTDRRRGQDELRVARQELQQRVAELAELRRRSQGADDQRFRRVVEAAPHAMVMINRFGRIELVNAQAERVFGHAREEMLDQPVEMLVPQRFRGRHPGLRGGFFAAPLSRPMAAGRDLFGLRRDGSEFPVEIGLNPIETEDGPMVLSAILDLSARVQLEALLRQAQKMEAVGRLTAGVAHDFNNLLQTMMGSLELLQDRLRPDPDSEELVAASIEAALRGARLTHHLLAFSRKQVLRPSHIELAGLLRRTVATLERTLSSDIRIKAVENDSGLRAYADPAQLEACILNLAINARDAMPGGGALTIRADERRVGADQATETLPAGDYAVLTVEDTGTGIEAADLDKVFEPFFTTKIVGEGSGLGLPMVLGYGRQSGGDVRIASTLGQGTRVELFLPCSLPADRRPATAGPGRETARGGAGHVLLVDDTAAVLQTLGAMLGGAGYVVAKAGNGEEALRVVSSGAALHCIVTDYAMPGMSGVELLRKVAALRPELPVLVVTGFPGLDTLRDLPDHVQILRKPFPRAELLRRVAGMVERAGMMPG